MIPAFFNSHFAGGYAALPVLNTGARNGRTGYIDYIQPEEMTAPIMRGVDNQNRHFVVIRARNSQGTLSCQTFFQFWPQQLGSHPTAEDNDNNAAMTDLAWASGTSKREIVPYTGCLRETFPLFRDLILNHSYSDNVFYHTTWSLE